MHSSIARWPSFLFYGDQLQNAESVKDLAPVPGFPWPADNTRVSFVHCEGEEDSYGNAFWNDSECRAIETLVQNLLDAKVPAQDIGVITLYEGQRQNLLWTLNKRIEVKNIDSFQGREKPFIVISLVRTGRKLGFITSGQRLNVALTRARRGLVVMGNFFSLYNGQDPEGYLWEFVHNMYEHIWSNTQDTVSKRGHQNNQIFNGIHRLLRNLKRRRKITKLKHETSGRNRNGNVHATRIWR